MPKEKVQNYSSVIKGLAPFIVIFVFLTFVVLLPEQNRQNAYIARKPELIREIKNAETIEEIRILVKDCSDWDCEKFALDRWVELANNKESAREVFKAYGNNDCEGRTKALKKWMTYCETAEEIKNIYNQDIYDLRDEHFELREIVVERWISVLKTASEAKELFNDIFNTDLRKRIFTRMVELCATPEEAEEAFFKAHEFSPGTIFDPPKLNEFELIALEKMFKLKGKIIN